MTKRILLISIFFLFASPCRAQQTYGLPASSSVTPEMPSRSEPYGLNSPQEYAIPESDLFTRHYKYGQNYTGIGDSFAQTTSATIESSPALTNNIKFRSPAMSSTTSSSFRPLPLFSEAMQSSPALSGISSTTKQMPGAPEPLNLLNNYLFTKEKSPTWLDRSNLTPNYFLLNQP